MKINVDEYGCCESKLCPYKRECAQHSSAGDFRSEDGFSPALERREGEVHCATREEPAITEEALGYFSFDAIPASYNTLGRGMISLTRVPEVVTYEI